MGHLCANRSAILAVKRDIKNTGAIRITQLTLQCQAFEHAWHHATVVITHRQAELCRLRAQQDASRMLAGNDLHGVFLDAFKGLRQGVPHRPARLSTL